MLFSIIIPVFNVEKYLRDCLDSVIHQTYSEWEAICVNDGSTDGSAGIMEEYAEKDSRIRIVSQANAGTAAARNTGIKEAAGDYIFFLDSDDWLDPDALRLISTKLNKEDIFCFNGKRYFESTESYNRADSLIEYSYQKGMDYYNENALIPRDFAFVCVVLRVYNRAFLMNNGLFFDEDVSFEDNLWVPIVLYHTKTVTVIPDVLYYYRIRKGSKMGQVTLERKKDMLMVANRLSAFFIPKSGFDKTIVYKAITHHYQAVLTKASTSDRKELNRLCDWSLYRKVCRTKLRHIVTYVSNRIKAL